LLGQAAWDSALSGRLGADQKAWLSALLSEARARRLEADSQIVAKLTADLLSADEAARAAAVAQLQAMNARAVGPLLAELKDMLMTPDVDAARETAILTVLKQIAPDLTGYDPASPVEVKLQRVESWQAGI
jgi:hypothetical protein